MNQETRKNLLPPNIDNVIDLARAEGARIRQHLTTMREALQAGDDAKALEVAREVCGLGEADCKPPSRIRKKKER